MDYSKLHAAVTGDTLQRRTLQRNWMLFRLHGAARFALTLGLSTHATEYDRLADCLKQEQKDDKAQELELRKKNQS